MLISCEKCSTTYVLDDALIPPEGAPVQCTRCQFVFTARKVDVTPPPPSVQTPLAPSAPAAGNSTMMFGTAASSSAGAPRPPATSAESAKNQTMMFGTPASRPTVAQPEQPPQRPDPKNQTMMFAGSAPQARAAAEEALLAQNSETAKNTTMMFGKLPPQVAAQAAAPAPAAPPNQEWQKRTQLYVRSSPQDQTIMMAPPVFPAEAPQTSSPAAATAAERARHEAETQAPEAVTPQVKPTIAEPRSRVSPSRPLELPPEADEVRPVSAEAAEVSADDLAALQAARTGGAGRIVVAILVLIALGLAGLLIYRLVGKQRAPDEATSQALRSTQQALAALRLDDTQTQMEVRRQLEQVLSTHPGFPQAHAALVLTSALAFDDAQGQLRREQERLRGLKNQNEASAEVASLEAAIAARLPKVEVLKGRLVNELEALQRLSPTPSSESQLDLLRAEGMARGVLGDADALVRAEAFRQQAAGSDDWVDLIEPEYALNGGSSQKEAISLVKAIKQRKTNSTFLRPYVVLARLQLLQGDRVGAKEELEQVITMNRRHEVAQKMLADL